MAKEGEYDNEMRGVLFEIDKEDRRERGPTYTGHCQIGGVQYRLAAWRNTSNKGVRYLSLRINLQEDDDDERPRKKKPSAAAKKESQKPIEDDDDYEARPRNREPDPKTASDNEWEIPF